jgi:hypothetical protein
MGFDWGKMQFTMQGKSAEMMLDIFEKLESLMIEHIASGIPRRFCSSSSLGSRYPVDMSNCQSNYRHGVHTSFFIPV